MAPTRTPQDGWEPNAQSAEPSNFVGTGAVQPTSIATNLTDGSKRSPNRARLEKSGKTKLQSLGADLATPLALNQCGVSEPPRQEHLVSVIEGEIIPRLMLIHRSEAGLGYAERPVVDTAMIAHFADIVQRASHEQALYHLKELTQDQLVPLHAIFKDLFAGTARRLGELWDSDQIDFVEVTIGLSRLQQLLHEMAPMHESAPVTGGRNALIVPTPGDQHTFGAMIVIQLFREAGWEVNGGVSYSIEELERIVRRQDFALIGFSLASEQLIDHLSQVIARVRKASRTADIAVVVGGHVSTIRPDLAAAVGADYSVTDPMRAVEFGSNWSDNVQIRPS
jgi:MerR family transcriptional regulator, light-induced transcriptional regulator